jgi:electron transfer flavoprotein alpha subunit
VAAVLVHLDLDGDRPHASSLRALAAGRAVASSWGATLYAAVIARDTRDAAEREAARAGAFGAPTLRVPGDARTIESIRSTLARSGADKIVVALTDAEIAPLWTVLGAAWQGVLDRLRPRLVVFGADAPSASELGPRTAARIGARLFLRARAFGSDEVELRDRDGGYVRAHDSGAAVALIGAAPRLEAHCEDDIDVMVLPSTGGGDPAIELAGTSPAELAHTTGTLIVIGDDAVGEPEVVKGAQRLAGLLGANVVGSPLAASAGVVGAGAIIDRGAPLAPELCIAIGVPAIDIAGSASVVRIATSGGKGVDAALTGPIATSLLELNRALGER